LYIPAWYFFFEDNTKDSSKKKKKKHQTGKENICIYAKRKWLKITMWSRIDKTEKKKSKFRFCLLIIQLKISVCCDLACAHICVLLVFVLRWASAKCWLFEWACVMLFFFQGLSREKKIKQAETSQKNVG